MLNSDPLVSIGLPVRNAGTRVVDVARSVLAQDHQHLELVISDNASTDDTREVCEELARSDSRVSYHRQAENVGILNNFRHAMRVANGTFFRWIGDDDRLEPSLVSRSLGVFAEDPGLVLVTTGLAYEGPDKVVQSAVYDGTALRSADPVDRFVEILRLLNESHLLIDPLYAMMRRAAVVGLPRRNMLREDEVFATRLALAGPWGHVPEVLARRFWKHERIGTIARRLGVPAWQSHFSNTLQSREILHWVHEADLTPGQRRRARLAVYRMYLRRQQRTVAHRSRKLLRMATAR
jgi:glycosyltransferase involved in cell wall biosynthesis